MQKLIFSRSFFIGIAGVVILIVVLMMFGVGRSEPVELVTATVETGPVRQLVSVSGIAEAEQSAELAFPVTGIVAEVRVSDGDIVEAGDVLVTLDQLALAADRQDALASLQRAVADRDELIAGPTGSAREVSAGNVALKQEALKTTIETETQRVENARRTLLSSGLEAVTDDASEDAIPPVITGTYSCNEEGEYVLDVFSSSAQSGYSYRLSGIESGTYAASVDQAISLGNCGLRIQFNPLSNYGRTNWRVEIPNMKSATYVANRNAYALAQTQAESAIAIAEQDVALAEANQTDSNAPARSEAVARADAAIAQAQARLARIDATIADRILVAPFAGTITEIDILPGETVTTAPIVTLLASAEFEVTARIPEIDIGKLLTGQRVEMVFDARSDELLTGEVDFISLKATEIDGVAYYEALIALEELPPWMRSGLNADIDIIINENADGLRVPKRFVLETETGYEVIQLVSEEQTASTSVEVSLEGNDGFISITGVNEGDILVAP